ncbi:hypothetical protein OUHCRE4_48460 [Enterobacter hormaechei subsp. steigerwaltii]
MKEGDKVHYVDSWGDIHTVRISYLFTSVMGNECAALSDGLPSWSLNWWR